MDFKTLIFFQSQTINLKCIDRFIRWIFQFDNYHAHCSPLNTLSLVKCVSRIYIFCCKMNYLNWSCRVRITVVKLNVQPQQKMTGVGTILTTWSSLEQKLSTWVWQHLPWMKSLSSARDPPPRRKTRTAQSSKYSRPVFENRVQFQNRLRVSFICT